MNNFRSHIIILFFLALSVVLWGVFLNLKPEDVAHATSYTLSDNATGGDCATFGSWDDLANICTLTDNLSGDDITISASNVTLDCDGKSITSAESVYTVFGSSVSNVTIKNCTIGGASGSQIRLIGGTGNAIINNTISYDSTDGIYVTSSDSYIINNSVDSTDTQGIYVSGTGNKIYGNFVDSNAGIGIVLEASTSELVGNTVSNNGQNTEAGVLISGSASTNIIRGNTVEQNMDEGIVFTSSGSGNLLFSNIVTDNYGEMTDIVGNASVSSTSDNNTCDTTTSYDDFTGGSGCNWSSPTGDPGCTGIVSIANGGNLKLTGDVSGCAGIGLSFGDSNLMLDCAGYSITGSPGTNGVWLNGNYDNVVIKNCTVSNFSQGISSVGTSDNTYIIKNTVSSNSSNGINAEYAGQTVVGNTVNTHTSSGFAGISVGNANADNVNVLYNTLSGNYRGIKTASGADSLTITGNVISSSTEVGLYINGSDSCTINKNVVSGSTSNGIQFTSNADSNTVEGNISINNGASGLIFGSTDNSNVVGDTAGGTTSSKGNVVYGNTTNDISDAGSNTGDQNTCNVVNGWNDDGETGCTYDSCGNGTTEYPPETCDDGGTSPSDGCSATCTIDSGYGCVGEPSVCTAAPIPTTESTITNSPPSFTADATDSWVDPSNPNWVAKTTTGGFYHYGMDFIDADNGWIVGRNIGGNADIYYSDDGGETWAFQTAPFIDDLWEVDMVDSSNGWAVASGGKIAYYNGTSWSEQTDVGGTNFRAIRMVDANVGWVGGTSGDLYKTVNGGVDNWGATVNIIDTTNALFWDIYAYDSNTAWVVGNTGTIRKTINGTDWTAQTSPHGGFDIVGIECVDANTCWFVGDSGKIAKTTNGGTNWNAQTSPTGNNLTDIDCIDANTCWAVGSAGILIKTTNGGTTWSVMDNGTSSSLDKVVFLDGATGWISGAISPWGTILKGDSQESSISYTTNAGETVYFKATGTDPNGDDYYLAVCTTSSVVPHNGAPPTCGVGTWAISGATTSGSVASASYTTTGSEGGVGECDAPGESCPWYAFVCDGKASLAGCSAPNQGASPGGDNNSSPFAVNNAPQVDSVSIGDSSGGTGPIEPGDTIYFNVGITDTDIAGGQDLIDMYVCSTDSFTPSSGCWGPAICSVTGVNPSGNAECNDSGSRAPVPTSHGSKAVYVFIVDNHGLQGTYASGDQSRSYSVTDVRPTYVSYTYSSPASPFTITAGGSQAVTFTVRINDDNGWDDVDSVEGVFFDDTIATADPTPVGNTNEGANNCDSTPGNGGHRNCYVDAVCLESALAQVDSTDVNAFCGFTVYYNANASTDWEMHGNPTDGNGKETGFDDSNVNIEIQSTAGIGVDEGSISYGSLEVDTASSGQSISVGDVGNINVDITIEGDNMCTDYDTCSGYTIDKNRQEWTQSGGVGFTWGTGHTLLATSGVGDADTNGCADLDLPVRGDANQTPPASENENIFWKIKLPATQATGTYTGQNTIAVISDSACTGTP